MMRVPAYFWSVVGPDIKIAPRRTGLGVARPLEPGMLVGGVIDDQLGDDTNAARMRLADELPEVGQRAVVGMDVAVFADVVAVVETRGRIERQQPDRVDAQIGDVVELRDQSREIADRRRRCRRRTISHAADR